MSLGAEGIDLIGGGGAAGGVEVEVQLVELATQRGGGLEEEERSEEIQHNKGAKGSRLVRMMRVWMVEMEYTVST